MRRPATPGSPVVVKIGSSSLAPASGGLDDEAVRRIVKQIDGLWGAGHPAVLVTSGAVAAGLPALDMVERPRDVPGLQVAAAVGQVRLMERYFREFAALGRVSGQVLLTRDILAHRTQYLHAREALERMLSLGVVPVVNENDTVVVDELKLGDNDRLAAIVSHLVGAGMLVILTDTEGLYSDDPRLADDAELITAVRHTDQVLDDLWKRSRAGALGSGGVATKVAAARMAAWSGIPTVIADAAPPDGALRAVAGAEVGTWVEPHETRLTSRKLWIAFGLPSEGTLGIDAGAALAITDRGKSLLAAGIVSVRGRFSQGAAVEIVLEDGALIGKGIVGMGAAELTAARGMHSSQAGGAAIHRDDLVIFR